MSASLTAFLYLVAGILFILALRGLSHPASGPTSRSDLAPTFGLPLLRCLSAIVLVTWLGSSTTEARSLTSGEQASLAKTVGSFRTAMQSRDFDAISNFNSPRILRYLAAGAGVTVGQLRKIVSDQMRETLAEVIIDSFGMSLAGAKHGELADGTPYVLLPTKTVIAPGGGKKMAVASHTLALIDGGSWYLLRVSEPQQLAILRQVYPGFVGVEFPLGSMTVEE